MKLVGLLLEEKMIAGVDQIAHRGGNTRTQVLRAMIYRALYRYRYQGDHTLETVPKFPKNLNKDPDKALVNGKVITVDDWGLIPPNEKLRPITRWEDLPGTLRGAAEHVPAKDVKPEGDDEGEGDDAGGWTWEQLMARSVPPKKVEP